MTWGEDPCDVDSHVVGKLSNGDSFHVYYRYKSKYDGDVEICNLDYDDTDSYGPEHITLKTTVNEPYYYFLHHYDGSGTITTSEAKVTVQQGNTLIATFNVPTNIDAGDKWCWNVFAIKDGKIIINNTITAEPNVNYAD